MDPRTAPAKQTPKSRRTRASILAAAMRLFATTGYHRATNGLIAKAAGLTRGAMLYHFPTREALVEAAVAYIDAERVKLFDAAAKRPPAPGLDAAEHVIDAYWALLHETPFLAFAELEAAARHDQMLAALLTETQSAYDHAQVGDRFLALAQAGDDPRFQASRDLGRFLLEGLSRGGLTYDHAARTQRLLAVVKRAVRMLNRKGDLHDLWPE